MTNRYEAHTYALDAAGQAHSLERAFLHIAEAVRRGEEPDKLTIGLIPGGIERLKALFDLLGLLKDTTS